MEQGTDDDPWCPGVAAPGGEEHGDDDAVGHSVLCDEILPQFPVPGELYVHLFAFANYYTALLYNHPPPAVDEPPYLVNQWQHAAASMQSPHRVLYGMQNPALRGVIITSHTVVPNFSWTPRLAVDGELLCRLLDGLLSTKPHVVSVACHTYTHTHTERERDRPSWREARRTDWDDWRTMHPGILLVPAVHGTVVRLFAYQRRWYLATNHRLEELGTPGPPTKAPPSAKAPGGLSALFQACLSRYYSRPLADFTRELAHPPGYCWFFALYPSRQSMLFLGTCRVLLHRDVRDGVHHVDLGFAAHAHLPPAIPILPDRVPTGSRVRYHRERLHSVHDLAFTDFVQYATGVISCIILFCCPLFLKDKWPK